VIERKISIEKGSSRPRRAQRCAEIACIPSLRRISGADMLSRATTRCGNQHWIARMPEQTPEASRGEITDRLLALRQGEPQAWESLVPLVYDQLRVIAHRHLQRESASLPLRTSELVHEAYLKLVDQTRVQWNDRAHFFAVASMVMRRILVNEAHRRHALKHGGGVRDVTLDEAHWISDEDLERIADLDEALTRLEALSPRQSQLLQHRFFGGLTMKESAAAIGVSLATAKRDLRSARAWLALELRGDPLT
jgi:RNA polymerase sigma factor (TIGR02999 family)